METEVPGNPGGENTGCQWTAACSLQTPLSQSELGRGADAGSFLRYLEQLDDVAAAGRQIWIPGLPLASSSYTHTQKGLKWTDKQTPYEFMKDSPE